MKCYGGGDVHNSPAGLCYRGNYRYLLAKEKTWKQITLWP